MGSPFPPNDSSSLIVLHRSWHISISLAYLPAWIIVALIWHYRIFTETNVGLVLVVHLLLGLSLASWSFFVAAPFGKSPQLAAVVSTFLSILFAILALVFSRASTGAATIFTIIFPPGYYIFAIRAICGYENHLMPTNLVKPDPDDHLTLLPIMVACIVSVILTFPIPSLRNLTRLMYFCGHIWERYLKGVSTIQGSRQTVFGLVSVDIGSRVFLCTQAGWQFLSKTSIRPSLPPCSVVRRNQLPPSPTFRWTSPSLVFLSCWVQMGEFTSGMSPAAVLIVNFQRWKVDLSFYHCKPLGT